MMNMPLTLLVGGLAGLIGIGLGYLTRALIGKSHAGSVENESARKLREAQRDADSIRAEARIQAKADVLRARDDFEKSVQSRRDELSAVEERIVQREAALERRATSLDRKEQAVDQKTAEVDKQAQVAATQRAEAERLVQDQRARLQEIAALTAEEARRRLLETARLEVQAEMGAMLRREQEQARDTAEQESRRIVAQAVQRYAGSHAGGMLTSTVPLASDEIKGRIIGREGRNIRAFEAATGVSILIDDTPEAVVVSGFDPIRREIARQSLEALIADGRIHPARIEEVVKRVGEEMEETMRAAGEDALYAAGVRHVEPELVRKLGRLKFRTSYTQNCLQHSIEVSRLMAIMTGELGLDVSIGRRVGLFHDIGKALDHEVDGGHAGIGADLLRRHGETAVVVNAVAAHHEDVPAESLYAVLCAAADAISSARPGARAETTELYVKRLEKLEAIANGFDGVKKSYAIQAGREVRLVVDPERVDDNQAMLLARDVSRKIESDLKYPGQIRVIVIRETRCVEYAR